MKQLIIAEKPNLAKQIKNAIADHFQYKDGYFESAKYVISFAYGHLFGLYDMEDYLGREKGASWQLEDLPFVPAEFAYKLKEDEDVKKRYDILSCLVQREDVSEILHCGDADREGEVIIRLILNDIFKRNQIKKPVKRIWLPETSDEGIQYALSHLEADSKYDDLYNEGLARTYLDWLLGINLTRYITCQSGVKLPVGRVLIPIVKTVYDRDMEIKHFVPKTYYQVESETEVKGHHVKLSIREPVFAQDKEKAAKILAAELNQYNAEVTSVEVKPVKKQPKKLFSLSKIQSELSKKYKMPLKESMGIIQDLYEKGYVTYPRTNTEYLAENEQGKVQKIITKLCDAGHLMSFKYSKRIFDDSKIESHSAITPTTSFPRPEQLNDKQKQVYTTILNRFISNFVTEETIVNQTIMVIRAGKFTFELKGEVTQQPGFYRYEPPIKSKDVLDLPDLTVSDTFQPNFQAVMKKTSPPKKLNAGAMSAYLENPFRKEKDTEDDEYQAILAGIEIGTSATRTGIIKNAIKYGYISEKDTIYSIEPKGVLLIKVLDQLHINLYKERTVTFSQQLKKVGRGEMEVKDVVSQAKEELEHIISQDNVGVTLEPFDRPERESIGKCPYCGQPVYENSKAFSCSGYKAGCKFALWKENKYLSSMGKRLTKTIAKGLLKNGHVYVKGLKSKQDKLFDADLVVAWEKPYPVFSLKFQARNMERR